MPADHPLTPLEQAMCAGPNNKGTILKIHVCHYKNSHNRERTYKSEQSSSSKHSYAVSVEISPETIKFGSIKFFLSHLFVGKSHLLAYIDWFGEYEHETESRIVLASTISMVKHNPFVLISQIRDQLVTAPSETEPNKLYILNY